MVSERLSTDGGMRRLTTTGALIFFFLSHLDCHDIVASLESLKWRRHLAHRLTQNCQFLFRRLGMSLVSLNIFSHTSTPRSLMEHLKQSHILDLVGQDYRSYNVLFTLFFFFRKSSCPPTKASPPSSTSGATLQTS